MKKLLLRLALVLFSSLLTAFADGARVMVWIGKSVDKNQKHFHDDEFDTAIRDLTDPAGSDWSFDKMVLEPDRVATFFADEIDRYDMILTCPLTDDIPADYTEKLKSWIEAGGALCITDMMYPGNYQYVTRINPNLFLGADSCGRKSNRYRSEEYTQPLDSIAFLPNLTKHQFVGWGHMWLPGNPGDWKVIKSCSCSEVEVLLWRFGKGFIYCSGKRDGRAALVENLRANLEVQRAGLSIESLEGFDADALTPGDYTLKLKVRSEEAWNGKLVWELRPLETSVKRAVPQKPEKFEALAKVTPGTSEITLKISLNTRGKSWVTLKLVGSGKSPSATLVSKAIDLPQLIDVKGSRYRNIIGVSEYTRYPGITRFPVTITPKDEKLSDMMLVAQVKDASGVIKGLPIKGLVPTQKKFLLPIKTGDLKPGKYEIHYLLKVRGVAKDAGKCAFTVMSNEECPVYINEDMNTVIRGQEIYPLGIYHMDGQVETMKELGFNTVHTWFGAGSNFKAQELGLYTICESFQNPWWKDVISCTNLLFWYTTDEPREQNLYPGIAANNLYKEGDPFHRPTMMVTMDSVSFTRQGLYGDVIGRDPYFFPGGGDKIAAEIDKTWEAVNYDQPVWHVPQAQWMKDPRMYKNAAFQGVVHGARGIFWYCWDDGQADNEYGGTGLKYETHLHDMVKETNADLKRLTPALLNPNRIQFQSPDKKIDGMLCADKKAKKVYCILVNRFEEELTLNLADIPELKTRGFGTQKKTLGPWEVAILEWPIRL